MASLDIPDNLGALIGSLGRVDSMGVLFKELGIGEFRNFLSKMLGQDIPYYIHLDTQDFLQVIDLLEGLEIFIPDSVDITQDDDHIRIPSGRQILDGDKILEYLLYKNDEEREQDLYNRRWAVLKAFIARLGGHDVYFNDPGFRKLIRDRFDTNLDETALSRYVHLLAQSNQEEMVSQRTMGNLRTVETKSGQKRLLFPHFEGQLLKLGLQQIISNLESAQMIREGGKSVKIEILNGTDQTGLARRSRDLFMNYGLEVSRIGNAQNSTDTTLIIDRKGNEAVAQEVAKIIRCENIITQIEASEGGDVDVTVVLGRDFNGWTVK